MFWFFYSDKLEIYSTYIEVDIFSVHPKIISVYFLKIQRKELTCLFNVRAKLVPLWHTLLKPAVPRAHTEGGDGSRDCAIEGNACKVSGCITTATALPRQD